MRHQQPGENAEPHGEVRANRDYRLRSLGSLPESYRATLEDWGVETSEVYGFLVARPGCGLPDKLVDSAAADLFASLAQPGRQHADIVGRLPELVLDGILEVESPAGFVSGPAAFDLLFGDPQLRIAGTRLGSLSRAALEYAARLRLRNTDSVVARLYGFHRVPMSRRWVRAYPDAQAVLDMLPRRALSRQWISQLDGRASHWLSWSSRDGGPADRSGSFPYKLYVSPRVEDLPDALPPLIEALTAGAAPRFKIGADAAGLLRPDKIVVYLRDAVQTDRVAQEVRLALAGVAPHGVPFSAELAENGLLSWGGDPPPDAAPVGRRAESWRFSICRRLAEHLLVAQRGRSPSARPVDFALARLALDGVDISSFSPAALERPSMHAKAG